ncbi:hypothetical protein Q3G72_012545 [Acer saccharum]|nr:hypothetical protein Q3G72_012545 [Acer saccharum]
MGNESNDQRYGGEDFVYGEEDFRFINGHQLCVMKLYHLYQVPTGSGAASIIFMSAVAGVVSSSVGSLYGVTRLLSDEKFLKEVISGTPMGVYMGRTGETKELPSLVEFLCMLAAYYVTGRVD